MSAFNEKFTICSNLLYKMRQSEQLTQKEFCKKHGLMQTCFSNAENNKWHCVSNNQVPILFKLVGYTEELPKKDLTSPTIRENHSATDFVAKRFTNRYLKMKAKKAVKKLRRNYEDSIVIRIDDYNVQNPYVDPNGLRLVSGKWFHINHSDLKIEGYVICALGWATTSWDCSTLRCNDIGTRNNRYEFTTDDNLQKV